MKLEDFVRHDAHFEQLSMCLKEDVDKLGDGKVDVVLVNLVDFAGSSISDFRGRCIRYVAGDGGEVACASDYERHLRTVEGHPATGCSAALCMGVLVGRPILWKTPGHSGRHAVSRHT